MVLRLPDLLPDPLDGAGKLQDRARGLRHSAVLPVLPLDHRKLRDRAGAERLSAPRHELGHHRGRLDAHCALDRHPGGLVDGVRADQAHQGHPALDALDQDDAAGRRAGADLPDLQDLRPARFPHRPRLHPVPRQSADRDLDAVHLFQGDPARHPRSRAHGWRHHRPRAGLRADADGDPGHRPCCSI
ncbi:hypothetical protein NK6_7291 [Bradyrhizobium diazoefficiens]|uniref:Uncharacterized protein n=1 Tax=Bradyrhizobium diazoefficiens TaxID=1355477 RepID=A0A0E4BUG2_9BRAD|nr:hypothetical protein NK6_7291 [Bradyrhizobium diazoefficiens]